MFRVLLLLQMLPTFDFATGESTGSRKGLEASHDFILIWKGGASGKKIKLQTKVP
jgi:hypothetical protein